MKRFHVYFWPLPLQASDKSYILPCSCNLSLEKQNLSCPAVHQICWWKICSMPVLLFRSITAFSAILCVLMLLWSGMIFIQKYGFCSQEWQRKMASCSRSPRRCVRRRRCLGSRVEMKMCKSTVSCLFLIWAALGQNTWHAGTWRICASGMLAGRYCVQSVSQSVSFLVARYSIIMLSALCYCPSVCSSVCQ